MSNASKRRYANAADLEAMPEIDFDRARFLKGCGPEAFENARKMWATIRGRPRKGEQAAGSKARSLRLPDSAWAELEQEAKQRKMSLHKLLRVIIAQHLYTTTWAERPKAPKVSSSGARKPPAKPKRRARKAAAA
jgi:hypothetical protein